MERFNNSRLFERYPSLAICKTSLNKALLLLIETFKSKGTLFALGNGGSSADAEHLCGELNKGFLLKRELSKGSKKLYDEVDPNLSMNLQEGLPAISLGVAHSFISAFSNDMNPQYVFAQQIHVLAKSNDLLFGISTSGNSKNIVEAFKVAKAKKITTIALTGENESSLSELANVTIKAPGRITHEVQELHLPIYHALCIELEKYFFSDF